MWTQAELWSSLLGYWAMGCGVWLFCPEAYDLLKFPPREIDTARLAFFAAWLLGDVLHLGGTVIPGHALPTQIALYIIVAVIEFALVNYILWCTGKYCCTRKRYPDEEVEDEKPHHRPMTHELVSMLGRGPDLAMPPGDTTLDDRRAARRQGKIDAANAARAKRGKKGWKEREKLPEWKMALIQVVGTLIVVGVFTAVWAGVVYMQQDTKEPPEEMKKPHDLRTWIGFGSGTVGFFFWVCPRLYSMYDAWKRKAQEGITTGSITVGALTHGFNTGSILLVNHTGPSLFAQAPYIATSVLCILLDACRLLLKAHYTDKMPPNQDHSVLYPARAYYDPMWRHDAALASKKKAKKSRTASARQALLRGAGKRVPIDSSDEEAARSQLHRGLSTSGEKRHARAHDGSTDKDDDDVDEGHYNSTQEHARYLARLGGAHALGGLGLAAQLHPHRLPGESDDDYEDRMIRAKATTQFARRRAEQARRLRAVEDLHGQLDDRRAKTLRREQEYAAQGTSDRRRREIERQLHATALRKEPAIHQALHYALHDPDVSNNDRDELQWHHRRLMRDKKDRVEPEERAIRQLRDRRLGNHDESDELGGSSGEGESVPLSTGDSTRVHHPSDSEYEREAEEHDRRRQRVGWQGPR